MSALAVEVRSPLAGFVAALRDLVRDAPDETRLLARAGDLLGRLIATDDWLPDAHAAPDPARYTQYLLHRDPADRFSVVSFVWGPGQATPIHDHRVWGLVGVLRGAELVEDFHRDGDGALRSRGPVRTLAQGQVEAFSPATGDLHRVANAHDDRTSVSIHVYGADIGRVRRATYDRAGRPTPFVSGYAPLEPLLP